MNPNPQRPYLFYDTAISICSICFKKSEGKIVFQDDKVFLLKRCMDHGWEKVLLADDIDYYRKAREVFLKVPEQPHRYNNPIEYGCPYDCGICPDHEQHGCVSLIEVTDHCNLKCPICYASSGPERETFRSLNEIEKMLDAVVANELEPDVVQISGGEPTLHPDFFTILDMAKARPIRHLMVNTNGIRLGKDREFAERLSTYHPHFEIYLQFDSLQQEPLLELRGVDLRQIHERALLHCEEFNLPVTLVATIKKGLNDDQLGEIVDFALSKKAVRGVTFQPIQDAGRTENYQTSAHRLTLTEVRRKILEQTDVFKPDDILPVPCHPDAIAMAYALKLDGEVVPLTGMIPLEAFLQGGYNSIAVEKSPVVTQALSELFSTHHSDETRETSMKQLLCCLPQVMPPSDWTYENIFRVIIMDFIDAHNFDLRSIKKSCVHIAQPNGQMIPFDTYNIFYRDDLRERVLEPIRQSLSGSKRHPPAPQSLVKIKRSGPLMRADA